MTIFEYKKLCSAILINSLDDICKGGEDGLDAMSWIHNPKDGYIFDFLVVCRSLRLDARTIRAVVKSDKIKTLLDEFKFLMRDARKEKVAAAPVRREYSPRSRGIPSDRGRRVASGR